MRPRPTAFLAAFVFVVLTSTASAKNCGQLDCPRGFQNLYCIAIEAEMVWRTTSGPQYLSYGICIPEAGGTINVKGDLTLYVGANDVRNSSLVTADCTVTFRTGPSPDDVMRFKSGAVSF